MCYFYWICFQCKLCILEVFLKEHFLACLLDHFTTEGLLGCLLTSSTLAKFPGTLQGSQENWVLQSLHHRELPKVEKREVITYDTNSIHSFAWHLPRRRSQGLCILSRFLWNPQNL